MGIAVKFLTKLEHLNLINVNLDDSIVEALLGMESLREVYLFKSGISEEAIKRLKDGRPKNVCQCRLGFQGFDFTFLIRKQDLQIRHSNP